MTGRLEGKAAVVTGTASGIDRAIAERRAQEGARVAAFLASDDARYVTGYIVVVDGGVTSL
jgi:NAD(P)-dependent dehydrogenase (short-subunit alcohol dehydrogenase family)